jgi:hypothetical protein
MLRFEQGFDALGRCIKFRLHTAFRSKVWEGILRADGTPVKYFGIINREQRASCAPCNALGLYIEDKGEAEMRAFRPDGSCALCNSLGWCVEFYTKVTARVHSNLAVVSQMIRMMSRKGSP